MINELADYIEYLEEYKGISGFSISQLRDAQLSCADPLHAYEFADSIMQSNKLKFQYLIEGKFISKYIDKINNLKVR